jgi:hypothetical protein
MADGDAPSHYSAIGKHTAVSIHTLHYEVHCLPASHARVASIRRSSMTGHADDSGTSGRRVDHPDQAARHIQGSVHTRVVPWMYTSTAGAWTRSISNKHYIHSLHTICPLSRHSAGRGPRGPTPRPTPIPDHWVPPQTLAKLASGERVHPLLAWSTLDRARPLSHSTSLSSDLSPASRTVRSFSDPVWATTHTRDNLRCSTADLRPFSAAIGHLHTAVYCVAAAPPRRNATVCYHVQAQARSRRHERRPVGCVVVGSWLEG